MLLERSANLICSMSCLATPTFRAPKPHNFHGRKNLVFTPETFIPGTHVEARTQPGSLSKLSMEPGAIMLLSVNLRKRDRQATTGRAQRLLASSHAFVQHRPSLLRTSPRYSHVVQCVCSLGPRRERHISDYKGLDPTTMIWSQLKPYLYTIVLSCSINRKDDK